ncbi:hypothetical protein [Streptosporangium sp. KLBMP 9127]|nr:hypothetical protein [Streptosporangium sp. KLBMP 9127]
MKFASAPARPLIALGVGLAMGATVLGAPTATAAAPPQGAYWHTRVLGTSTHPWRFGTTSDPYSLVQREILESWSLANGRTWTGMRELGTLPKSAADKKAWQRDGSPAKWSQSIDGKTVKLSAKPANGHLAPALPERNEFQLDEQWLTYDEVQRLPADPSRLKDWLTKAAQVSRTPESSMASWLTGTLSGLLHSIPAPQEVRTAAYQALLALPGVRADGNAKDNLGRPGAAVVIHYSIGTGKNVNSVKQRLIVDTARMVLLSQDQTITQRPSAFGGKTPRPETYNKTLIEVGWTNSQPTVPALP